MKALVKVFEHPIAVGVGCLIVSKAICKIIRCTREEHQKSKMTPEQILELERLKVKEKESNIDLKKLSDDLMAAINKKQTGDEDENKEEPCENDDPYLQVVYTESEEAENKEEPENEKQEHDI